MYLKDGNWPEHLQDMQVFCKFCRVISINIFATEVYFMLLFWAFLAAAILVCSLLIKNRKGLSHGHNVQYRNATYPTKTVKHAMINVGHMLTYSGLFD